MVIDGNRVSIEYTLTLHSGETADTNVGEAPLRYQHGAAQLLPDLERALTGLAVGDETTVTLSPEQGPPSFWSYSSVSARTADSGMTFSRRWVVWPFG